MAWTITTIDSYVVGNPGTGHPRLVTISDCVYGGTGYGGGLLSFSSSTGATAATGPTKSDLGFTGTTDASFCAQVFESANTGTVHRSFWYDTTKEALVVGATAATDFSNVTYRIIAQGKYGA